jgi:hypothetical protein
MGWLVVNLLVLLAKSVTDPDLVKGYSDLAAEARRQTGHAP